MNIEKRQGEMKRALFNNNSHLSRSICSPSHQLILNMDKVNYTQSGGQLRLVDIQVIGLPKTYNCFFFSIERV